MSILFRFLLWIAWAVSGSAWAASVSLGSILTVPSSSVDHSKLGPSISSEFGVLGQDFRVAVDLGLSSLTAVNPGAGGNPTAPDEKESHGGSVPFYGSAQWFPRASWTLAGLRLRPGVGVQSFFTDLAMRSGAVPIAPSFFLTWRAEMGLFGAAVCLAAGLQATRFDPVTALASPEVRLSAKIGARFFATLGASSAVVLAMSSPSVLDVYPRAGLALGFAFGESKDVESGGTETPPGTKGLPRKLEVLRYRRVEADLEHFFL